MATSRGRSTSSNAGRPRAEGTFTQPRSARQRVALPERQGSLLWIPSAFRVTDVTTGLYGGSAKFNYTMEPFGNPTNPAGRLGRDLRGCGPDHPDGFSRAPGHSARGQRLGPQPSRMAAREVRGEARRRHVVATMPPGMQPMTRQMRADPNRAPSIRCRPSTGHSTRGCRSATCRSPETSPTRWTPTGSPSRAAGRRPRKTYVDFTGRTAWAKNSHIPFTSRASTGWKAIACWRGS